MTLASMFATVRQGFNSLGADRSLKADVEATARRSDDLSIISLVKAERKAWMEKIDKLERTTAVLRGQIAYLEQRVTALEKGNPWAAKEEANR